MKCAVPTPKARGGGRVIPFLPPPERKALAHICATADLLMVGGCPWLLVPADDRLLDTLAAFGAEAEDREDDPDDEPFLGSREKLNQTTWTA